MQLSTQKEKKKSGFLVFTSSTNVKLESSVNVVVVQAKKARTWTLFCKSPSMAFLPFSLPLPSSLLKLKILRQERLSTRTRFSQYPK